MKLSTALLTVSVVIAVDAQFDQYKAKFQNFLGSFGVKAPSGDDAAAPAAGDSGAPIKEEVAVEPVEVSVLTLENWKDTLYGPVKEDATTPEEWWVFITGGNKTCDGYCEQAEKAFNASAQTIGAAKGAPHLGYINCEQESILCHTVNCWPGSLWIFDMLPPPAAINIYGKRLNLSSIEASELVALQASGSRESFHVVDGIWHPFDGTVAEFGLLTAAGYFSWAMSHVPNWLFVFVISMASRMFMNRRMNSFGMGPNAADAPPAGAAAPAQ